MLVDEVQLYVYGAVPPPAATVAEPLLPPLQVTLLIAITPTSGAKLALKVTEPVLIQPVTGFVTVKS